MTRVMEPNELRARGFEALVQALGWVNAVRFIHEYEPSKLNYTTEREAILPDWDAAELARRMDEMSPKA